MSVRLLDELFGYRGLLPFSWLFGRCHASLFRCVLENFHSTRHIDGRWAYAGAIAALDAFERSGEYGLCNAVRFIMRIEVAHGYLHHGAGAGIVLPTAHFKCGATGVTTHAFATHVHALKRVPVQVVIDVFDFGDGVYCLVCQIGVYVAAVYGVLVNLQIANDR